MEDFEEKLNHILASPEAMGQIMALANSLSAGAGPQEAPDPPSEAGESFQPAPSQEENPLALLQGMDPGMIQKAMNLFRTYNGGNNEKTALLMAIRPFVREDRRGRLDKAIQIARYSRVIRAAMQEFRGGADV